MCRAFETTLDPDRVKKFDILCIKQDLWLRLKVDPLFKRYQRQSSIYLTPGNNFTNKKKVKVKDNCSGGQCMSTQVARQDGFFRSETARKSIPKLVRHLNHCFEQLYRTKYPKISDYLPIQVMYRCYLLSHSLLAFELAAIFAPEEIEIDPFELLKCQGGLSFNALCSPTGLVC